jgi:type III secretion protein T
MNDYISLYLNSILGKSDSAAPLMALFLLGVIRLLPIIGMVPFLGSKNLNRPAKICFACVLVFILFPKMLLSLHSEIYFDVSFVGLALKEFFVGFSIALMTAMPFYIAESAGVLIDHQRGASSLMVNDPIFLNQNSPTGVLFNYVGIVLFFWVGGPFLFFDALIMSFDSIPVDQFLSPHFFQDPSPFLKKTLVLLNDEMTIAVRLATPALILMLMTDSTLGIINRLAPQVMITFLGMPLKSLLGISVVWLGWFVLIEQFSNQYILWMGTLKEVALWFSFGK